MDKYLSEEYVYRGSLFLKKRLYPRMYSKNKKYIFATSSLDLAISYIRSDNAMIAQNDDKKIKLYELQEGEFDRTLKQKGFLYIFYKSKFIKSNLGNLITEYISEKIQKPVAIININNPLKLLEKSKNVKLYYKKCKLVKK
jgi:hypothetical protein